MLTARIRAILVYEYIFGIIKNKYPYILNNHWHDENRKMCLRPVNVINLSHYLTNL